MDRWIDGRGAVMRAGSRRQIPRDGQAQLLEAASKDPTRRFLVSRLQLAGAGLLGRRFVVALLATATKELNLCFSSRSQPERFRPFPPAALRRVYLARTRRLIA